MVFRSFFSTIALLFTILYLQAQEHSYAHYSVHDGLAGSTVYSMAQDRDGFIWFCTETGVSRFDGTHFKNFTTRDGLPDNEVLKVFVDAQNRVWFIPFTHSIAYYYKGKLHNQENDTLLRRLKFLSVVTNVLEDSSGNIVISERELLHIIDSNGHIREVYSYMPQDPRFDIHAAIMAVGLNSRQHLRLSYAFFGMHYCDVIGDSLVPVRFIENGWWNNTQVLMISPNLETYVQYDSIVFFHPQDSTEFRVLKPKGFIGLSRINDSEMVLNTYVSTYLLDMRRRKITDSFLVGQSVNSVIEDTEGSLWFSTLGRGVYRLGSRDVNNYFFPQRGNNLGIFSIARFGHDLYFGGDHYFVARLDLRTGSSTKAVLDSNNTRGRVTGFVQQDREHIVVGTDLGLFLLKDLGQKAGFVGVTESIKSIMVTRDSTLFFSSDKYTQEWRLKELTPIDTQSKARATCAWKNADQIYFLGTVNGLYSCKKGEKPLYLGDRWKVLKHRINAMKEDDDGVLWLATDGDGAVGYKNGEVTAHITESDGLTSNICRTIFIAGRDIWVGTDQGLNKVVRLKHGYRVTPFTMLDGLSSDEINAIYVEGNNVFAGNSEGVTYFDETKISRRSGCNLRINAITVSDIQWDGDTTGFMIDHKNNNIKFDFVAISFRSAGNIRYRYRLLGLDTIWRSTQETFLSYPSLPSGNYELQLAAINKFGIESRQASIPFVVDKLLWEKWWFRLLAVFTVGASVFIFFNYRLRIIRKKEREKTEINTKIAELEQMALRSQMNPHFIFNCLNSIQQYVLYRDVLGANEFITKFSYLIRQTLDLSARRTISIQEEIDYIDTYMSLEKKRFDDKFVYEIDVSPEVDRSECHIPPMILQPYIENAVRHGIGLRNDNDGRLWVKMHYADTALVCIIEDNGVGRRMAMQFKSRNSIAYQSVGMSLVSKRIEVINQASQRSVEIHIEDLEDSAGKPMGTRIRIYFPLEIVLVT